MAKSVARQAVNELKSSTYNNAMRKSSKRMRNARDNGDKKTYDKELDRASRFSTAAADAYNRENPKKGGHKHKDVMDENNSIRMSESYLRNLVSDVTAKFIRESRRRNLREGTTDLDVANKWFDAVDYAGPQAIIDAVYNYLNNDQLAEMVELFERDGLLPTAEEEYDEEDDF